METEIPEVVMYPCAACHEAKPQTVQFYRFRDGRRFEKVCRTCRNARRPASPGALVAPAAAASLEVQHPPAPPVAAGPAGPAPEAPPVRSQAPQRPVTFSQLFALAWQVRLSGQPPHWETVCALLPVALPCPPNTRQVAFWECVRATADLDARELAAIDWYLRRARGELLYAVGHELKALDTIWRRLTQECWRQPTVAEKDAYERRQWRAVAARRARASRGGLL